MTIAPQFESQTNGKGGCTDPILHPWQGTGEKVTPIGEMGHKGPFFSKTSRSLYCQGMEQATARRSFGETSRSRSGQEATECGEQEALSRIFVWDQPEPGRAEQSSIATDLTGTQNQAPVVHRGQAGWSRNRSKLSGRVTTMFGPSHRSIYGYLVGPDG